MTTEFKTKAQAKAENASQDTRSQDANKVNTASIPVIEGIEGSLEKLYALNRSEAHRLTQTVKVAAYKDEFQCAIAELEKGLVSPSFFDNLQKNYSPVAINHVPMLLLTQSGAEISEATKIKTLTDRFDELVTLEQSSEISDEELAELDEVEAQLKELGVLKRQPDGVIHALIALKKEYKNIMSDWNFWDALTNANPEWWDTDENQEEDDDNDNNDNNEDEE